MIGINNFKKLRPFAMCSAIAILAFPLGYLHYVEPTDFITLRDAVVPKEYISWVVPVVKPTFKLLLKANYAIGVGMIIFGLLSLIRLFMGGFDSGRLGRLTDLFCNSFLFVALLLVSISIYSLVLLDNKELLMQITSYPVYIVTICPLGFIALAYFLVIMKH
ncbi:MAG: hypothetical protein P4N59_12235 [Negativicutes bacterium]|nr:hypothetical protein [Negativicutes bacterium]